MAKITRVNGNVKAFGSAQASGERTLFGQTTVSDDLTAQFTAEFLRGWGIVGASDFPKLQDFNAATFTNGQLLAYLHQMGLPEYNSAQEFYLNSITQFGGALYMSIQDGNTGRQPNTNPAWWKPLLPSQATEAVAGIAAIATNGDMAAQSNDTKIVTPQKLTSWFNTKLASYVDKGITSFATSGEVITGEAEAKSVSPATIRFGFQVLKSTTGYIKFPDWLGGLIVQWTKTPVLGISVPYNWVYPIQFPNIVTGTFGMFIGFSQGTLEVTETPTLTNSRFANGLAGSTAGPAFVFAWGF